MVSGKGQVMDYIDDFLDVMVAEKGSSPRTISSYRSDLNDLSAFLSVRKTKLHQASQKQIQDYLGMIVQNKLSPKTQARRLSCIKEFFKYLNSEDICTRNPVEDIDTPKTEKSLPKYLTEEEVNLMLNTAYETDFRIAVGLEVLYASGMRVSELVSLPTEAVLHHQEDILITGKGGKQRIVPLNKIARQALEKWLVVRESYLKKGRTSKWLFPSKSKQGYLTRDAFFKALKKIAILCGIDKDRVSPHVFRHSVASHMIAHDADLRTVQKILGHSDIATTEIYTHIQEDRLKKTISSKHPLSKWGKI